MQCHVYVAIAMHIIVLILHTCLDHALHDSIKTIGHADSCSNKLCTCVQVWATVKRSRQRDNTPDSQTKPTRKLADSRNRLRYFERP